LYLSASFLTITEYPTAEKTARIRKRIPIECEMSNPPFSKTTSNAPGIVIKIPKIFTGEIFSLKKRIPAIIAKTGMVEIITELIVTELTYCKPNVSPIKYKKGSKKESRMNVGKSLREIFFSFFKINEIVVRIKAASDILRKIKVKAGNPLTSRELLQTKEIPQRITAVITDK